MKFNKYLLAFAAGAGMSMAAPGAHAGGLAPRLAQLAAHYSQAPAKVARSIATQPEPTGRGIFEPHVNASGEVQVYIRYRPGEQPSAMELQMLGAKHMLSALGVIQAWVPITRLGQLSKLAGVTRVALPAYAIVRGAGGARTRSTSCNTLTTGLNIDASAITAENIGALQSQGFTGSGVKVGIISNGIDCLASSQAAGYTPSSVWEDSNDASWGSTGAEGTAMLEEVHAAAPGAQLGFCAPTTSVEFVTCYKDFATWGAEIISDDLGFPNLFFNNYSGTIAFNNAIQSFSQSNPAISLVTAAGNDRQDYFQGVYAPSSASSPITLSPSPGTNVTPGGTTGRTYKSVMNIGGQPYEGLSIANGISTYFLMTWNDPLNGPYDDLDLYLVNSSNQIVGASTFDQASDSSYTPNSASWIPPMEYISYTNNSGSTEQLKLVVMCYSCSQTNNLLVKLDGSMDGGGAFATIANGGVYGQTALPEEIATAAGSTTDSTNTSVRIENFSETGPYIGGDWLNGTTSVPKPDITGVDGMLVSGAGGFGISQSGGGALFYGTSAASPNVASVLALLRSAFPTLNYTAAQWKTLIENNANTARLVNSPSSSEAGAGLVDASASAAAVDPPITAAITTPTGNPIDVKVNTSIQFQAVCNYSGTNTLSYKWTFGANSGIPDSTQLSPPAVKYTQAGTYTVTFTCSDPVQSVRRSTSVVVTAPSSSGGGGGTIGFGSLAGLIALAGLLALRRRS